MLTSRLAKTALSLALLLGACTTSSTPAPAKTAESKSAEVPAKPAEAPAEFAPTPYTAEQIRDASGVGRTYEWKREIGDQPPTRHVIVFAKVTPENAELATTDYDEQGKVITPEKLTTSTWEELRQHAQFPRDAVEISNETITVPAGTFECQKYTVTKGQAAGMTFYFAKSLPGAPVLYYKTVGGTRLMTATLIRHVPGKAP